MYIESASSFAMDALKVLVYCSICIFTLTGCCQCIRCWLCLGEGCDLNPSLNHRAETQECQSSHCQTVEFHGYSTIDESDIYSTARSCTPRSEKCLERNEFNKNNCTETKMKGPGCVRSTCCTSDFCNSANTTYSMLSWKSLSFIFQFLFVIIFIL